jgi:hypothetical protein
MACTEREKQARHNYCSWMGRVKVISLFASTAMTPLPFCTVFFDMACLALLAAQAPATPIAGCPLLRC